MEEEEKMTLKDCYMQMGADYEETVQRLRSESLIQRIILKFPQDPSYQELCQALADGNIEAISKVKTPRSTVMAWSMVLPVGEPVRILLPTSTRCSRTMSFSQKPKA